MTYGLGIMPSLATMNLILDRILDQRYLFVLISEFIREQAQRGEGVRDNGRQGFRYLR
jgi:hypothetical protein